MTPAEILEQSDERDRWLARVLAAERAGFDRGRAIGYSEGRRDVLEEEAAAQRAAARLVHPDNPTYAELDRLRYPPLGRKSWLLRQADPA